jgi:hypothetical protein
VSRQPTRETDQLTHIIRTIQRARRSGMLEVQRTIGSSFVEAGTIIFVKGSIVDAHVGRSQGKEASNILSQWKHCSFTFTSSNPHDPPLEFPSSIASIQTGPLLNYPQDTPLPQTDNLTSGLQFTAIPVHLKTSAVSLQQIERLNYPRPYRQLCLLINGRHSIADLSRLLGRQPIEVVKMLDDLEKAQCIRVPHK